MLYRVEEIDATKRMRPAEAVPAVGGGWLARWALAMLRRRGRVEVRDGRLAHDRRRPLARRAARPRASAVGSVSGEAPRPAADHVHAPADRVEHFINEPLREELQKAVDDTHQDPHGREIPS